MAKSSGSPSVMQLPSQNTTTTQLPAWVEQAGQANYNMAANMDPWVFKPYEGVRVQPLNEWQYGALSGLINNIGSGAAGYQNAQNAVTNALSGLNGLSAYTPSNVSSNNVTADKVAYGAFNPSQLAQYFNPYTSEVIDASMRQMDQQKAGALNQNADLAAKQSAFGNSRRTIMDAVTDAQYGMNAASLAANLRNQGYTQAMDAYGTDRARTLQAGLANQQTGLTASMANQDAALKAALANQSAGLTAANLNNQLGLDRARLGLTGAGLMGTLTGQQQADYLASAQGGLNAANQIYNTQQAWADSNQQAYKEYQNAALAPLNLRLQALGMTPYGNTTTATGFTSQAYQPTSSSPFMSALGAAGSLGSMFAAPAGGTSAAAGIGSALTSLLGFMSDKNMKTDIEKLGKDEETGLDMYAYRYKGDPKSYPKVVGPMAQDIQARDPSGVKKIGGKLVVKGLL